MVFLLICKHWSLLWDGFLGLLSLPPFWLSAIIPHSHNFPACIYYSMDHRKMQLFMSFIIYVFYGLLGPESLFILAIDLPASPVLVLNSNWMPVLTASDYSPFQSFLHILKEVEKSVDFTQILSAPPMNLYSYDSLSPRSYFPSPSTMFL